MKDNIQKKKVINIKDYERIFKSQTITIVISTVVISN